MNNRLAMFNWSAYNYLFYRLKISNIKKEQIIITVNTLAKPSCRPRNKTLQLKSLVPFYLTPYICSTRDIHDPEFSVYQCHTKFYIFI